MSGGVVCVKGGVVCERRCGVSAGVGEVWCVQEGMG